MNAMFGVHSRMCKGFYFQNFDFTLRSWLKNLENFIKPQSISSTLKHPKSKSSKDYSNIIVSFFFGWWTKIIIPCSKHTHPRSLTVRPWKVAIILIGKARNCSLPTIIFFQGQAVKLRGCTWRIIPVSKWLGSSPLIIHKTAIRKGSHNLILRLTKTNHGY